MKKIYYSVFMIAAIITLIMGCKKDDDTTASSDPTTSSIIGSWGSTKLEAYLMIDDRKVFDSVFTDIITMKFNADGTFSGNNNGELGSGTYNLIDKNNKKYLITISTGEQADTVQIENITSTQFNFNFKEQGIAAGDPYYPRIFFVKK